MKKSAAIILQARNKSTRLPFKVTKDLGGRPLLLFLIERLKRAKTVDDIIIATTEDISDDSIVDLARDSGLIFVRGSANNVLSRYVQASNKTKANTLIRITGDSPFVDPLLIDSAVTLFLENNFDYISNTNPPTYPDGLDIEVFSRKALMLCNQFSSTPYEKEHVTPWMRQNSQISKFKIKSEKDFSNIRLTVDEPEDLEVIRKIVHTFKNNSNFSWNQVIKLYEKSCYFQPIVTKE